MTRGKHTTQRSRNQNHLAISGPSNPTTAKTGYPNILEKQNLNLISYFTMMMENFEKYIYNTLKEV